MYRYIAKYDIYMCLDILTFIYCELCSQYIKTMTNNTPGVEKYLANFEEPNPTSTTRALFGCAGRTSRVPRRVPMDSPPVRYDIASARSLGDTVARGRCARLERTRRSGGMALLRVRAVPRPALSF